MTRQESDTQYYQPQPEHASARQARARGKDGFDNETSILARFNAADGRFVPAIASRRPVKSAIKSNVERIERIVFKPKSG